jgi:pimeloyl-ACP methyl ester carboxylesterase
MRFSALLFLVLALLPHSVHAQDPLALTTADDVMIYGDHYHAEGDAKATILAFHQAKSNRGEYDTIIPRLTKAGFDVVVIDQRSGGTAFGRENATARRLEDPADYLEALPDLETALGYARFVNAGKPIIAWGSSYSASLVFLLAAKHPQEISAVLAFSPGEYFPDKKLVAAAASKVTVPVFVTSSPDAGEVSQAKAILAAAPAKTKVQFVPQAGVHGSSILNAKADPDGAAAAWSAVDAFLAKAVKGGQG